MRLFETTGLAGMLVILMTFALGLAGVVCLVVRVPRWVAVSLLVASVLPLLVGSAGMALARVEMEAVLATLKAPEPRDRAGGEYEALFRLLIGLVGTLVAFAAALAALARSRAHVPVPGEE